MPNSRRRRRRRLSSYALCAQAHTAPAEALIPIDTLAKQADGRRAHRRTHSSLNYWRTLRQCGALESASTSAKRIITIFIRSHGASRIEQQKPIPISSANSERLCMCVCVSVHVMRVCVCVGVLRDFSMAIAKLRHYHVAVAVAVWRGRLNVHIARVCVCVFVVSPVIWMWLN